MDGFWFIVSNHLESTCFQHYALLFATNSSHALRPHNRKFYYNSLKGGMEPIYFDGNPRDINTKWIRRMPQFSEYPDLKSEHFLALEKKIRAIEPDFLSNTMEGNLFLVSEEETKTILENILLKIDSSSNTIKEIKLADFGLIKTINDETIDEDGTYLYKSPERNNYIYNTSCDIYSLGIIIYELLNNWSTQMERIKMISLLKNNPEVIPEQVIVKKMVSIDYTKRPTAKQLLNLLEEVIEFNI